ncbi:hypothetical protein MIND_00460300 [Mycena indigotica]|uniref:Uncharacterized protein n=1 Tax=Mycena indigotica TaxID=2126181 RepID=A0A8H6SXW9_9AGAR|nr:uncharacterized protein MIND_00460300 [Mycena indigotica]KAF7306686.1 hypothetical protein MIND_00460300 [Mycena indigotica]
MSSPKSSYLEPPTPAQPQTRRRPLIQAIESAFPAFDCDAAVVHPFQDENQRDTEFQKELNEMLLNCTIEMHAWASARPFYETRAASSTYESQLQEIQLKEREQEKTRQRLQEFVSQMRSAMALLR